MSDRLTLALPIDVVRAFDHTATQTQLSNNTFQGTPDDRDTLASLIEDAEGEFRRLTNSDMRVSRAGSSGDRETYPQLTYKVPGHPDFRRSWTGFSAMYDLEEVEKNLRDDRILPFDSTEGDEAYVYTGLGGSSSGDEWEDVTDEYGDSWTIVNHRSGTIKFDPLELLQAMAASRTGLSLSNNRLKKLRFAISYRHGTLGGSRSGAGATTLDTSISDSDTGATSVGDASNMPDAGGLGGSLILLLGTEYVRATTDPSGDTIDILERGVRGTNAASHSSGDRVQYTPPEARTAVKERAKMWFIQSGRYSAYLPDADDTIDKGEMLEEARSTWSGIVEALS